jgi:hypothetical protein
MVSFMQFVLSAIMLNVVIFSVIMLSVVAAGMHIKLVIGQKNLQTVLTLSWNLEVSTYYYLPC